jgi:hypothetical protein
LVVDLGFVIVDVLVAAMTNQLDVKQHSTIDNQSRIKDQQSQIPARGSVRTLHDPFADCEQALVFDAGVPKRGFGTAEALGGHST